MHLITYNLDKYDRLTQNLYVQFLELAKYLTEHILKTDLGLLLRNTHYVSNKAEQQLEKNVKLRLLLSMSLQHKYRDCLKIEPIFASEKTTNHWEFSLNTENFGVLGMFPKSTWNPLMYSNDK